MTLYNVFKKGCVTPTYKSARILWQDDESWFMDNCSGQRFIVNKDEYILKEIVMGSRYDVIANDGTSVTADVRLLYQDSECLLVESMGERALFDKNDYQLRQSCLRPGAKVNFTVRNPGWAYTVKSVDESTMLVTRGGKTYMLDLDVLNVKETL
jgi:hypothetical protein